MRHNRRSFASLQAEYDSRLPEGYDEEDMEDETDDSWCDQALYERGESQWGY